MERLRAVVIGAGWAGEGHVKALRWCGVDVAAICARQQEVVEAVAGKLGVAEASTDWRRSLASVAPDIVTIATPATLRREVVDVAAASGCHILCEKPLAACGEEAERLYRAVEEAGVKHAYGATQRYDASCAWLAELVREGAIGTLREIVVTGRRPALGSSIIIPWSWSFSLAAGGGLLNLGFTHLLGNLSTITGGLPVRAMGEARRWLERAPVVPDIHDSRTVFARARELTPESVAGLEWRDCDADGAHSALLRFDTPTGEVPIAVVQGIGTPAPGEITGMRLYGAAGTLMAEGRNTYTVSRLTATGGTPEPLPVPERLLADLPTVGEEHCNKWAALLRDYIADIRGEAHRPYPTFRDGWRTQVAIDAIRAGSGWRQLPE